MLNQRIVHRDQYLAGGLTGKIYKVQAGYLEYLHLETDIDESVDCVCKIVKPCKVSDPDADDYYEMTDVRDEITFNALVCAKDPLLAVPILHWFIYYTRKEDAEQMLMNSHGDGEDEYVNQLHSGLVKFVNGTEANLNSKICWTQSELDELSRPATEREKQERTTIKRVVLAMPLYDGDVMWMMNKYPKPSRVERYRICSEVMHLILRLHKCGVVHGDNHERNILYKDVQGTITFRLHDFGRSRHLDETKPPYFPPGRSFFDPLFADLGLDVAKDIGRLGGVCLSIIKWRKGHYKLAEPYYTYKENDVPDSFARDMLDTLRIGGDTLKTDEHLARILKKFDQEREVHLIRTREKINELYDQHFPDKKRVPNNNNDDASSSSKRQLLTNEE